MKIPPFYRRILSFAVLISFASSCLFSDLAIAAVPSLATALPKKSWPQDPSEIVLKPSLGKILEAHRGSKETVLLLQDAHSIPGAQRSIQKIIEYFQKEYGLRRIVLEGASTALDPQFLRSFPDRDLLRKTLEIYFEKGEITGVTAAALLNEDGKAVFQGVEDWDLYEKGLGLFLAAQKDRVVLEPKIAARQDELRARKEKIYGPALLKIDRVLTAFHRDQASLFEVLKQLAEIRKPEAGSELEAVLAAGVLEKEDAESLKSEIKKAVDSLRAALSGPSLLELNGKYQEFQTSKIAAEEFALFLSDLAELHHVVVVLPDSLRQGMRHYRQIRTLEGSVFFKAFERYAADVKALLMKGEEEKRLDEETAQLETLERLASLELSREDWEAVKKSSFELEDFSSSLSFYENAEKREAVLLKNALSPEPVLFVAGGFHTQGLIEKMKAANLSYAVVMPAIPEIPEQIPYEEHMRGDVSWKAYFEERNGKINLYEAFVRHARDQLLEASGPAMRKFWRDQILRDLAETERLEQAARYTAFLDENLSRQTFQDPSLQRLGQFIQGLKHLNAQDQVTPHNILSLLQPSAIPSGYIAPVLQPTAALPRLQVLETDWDVSRSEVRLLDDQALTALREEMVRKLGGHTRGVWTDALLRELWDSKRLDAQAAGKIIRSAGKQNFNKGELQAVVKAVSAIKNPIQTPESPEAKAKRIVEETLNDPDLAPEMKPFVAQLVDLPKLFDLASPASSMGTVIKADGELRALRIHPILLRLYDHEALQPYIRGVVIKEAGVVRVHQTYPVLSQVLFEAKNRIEAILKSFPPNAHVYFEPESRAAALQLAEPSAIIVTENSSLFKLEKYLVAVWIQNEYLSEVDQFRYWRRKDLANSEKRTQMHALPLDAESKKYLRETLIEVAPTIIDLDEYGSKLDFMRGMYNAPHHNSLTQTILNTLARLEHRLDQIRITGGAETAQGPFGVTTKQFMAFLADPAYYNAEISDLPEVARSEVRDPGEESAAGEMNRQLALVRNQVSIEDLDPEWQTAPPLAVRVTQSEDPNTVGGYVSADPMYGGSFPSREIFLKYLEQLPQGEPLSEAFLNSRFGVRLRKALAKLGIQEIIVDVIPYDLWDDYDYAFAVRNTIRDENKLYVSVPDLGIQDEGLFTLAYTAARISGTSWGEDALATEGIHYPNEGMIPVMGEPALPNYYLVLELLKIFEIFPQESTLALQNKRYPYAAELHERKGPMAREQLVAKLWDQLKSGSGDPAVMYLRDRQSGEEYTIQEHFVRPDFRIRHSEPEEYFRRAQEPGGLAMEYSLSRGRNRPSSLFLSIDITTLFKDQIAAVAEGSEETPEKIRMVTGKALGLHEILSRFIRDAAEENLLDLTQDNPTFQVRAPSSPALDDKRETNRSESRWQAQERSTHGLAVQLFQRLAGTTDDAKIERAFLSGGEYEINGKTVTLEQAEAVQRKWLIFTKRIPVLRIGTMIFIGLPRPPVTFWQRLKHWLHAKIWGLPYRSIFDRIEELYNEHWRQIILNAPPAYANPGSKDPVPLVARLTVAAIIAYADEIRGKAVADLGAGEGLLSRIALRLGAASVVLADDNDKLNDTAWRRIVNHDEFENISVHTENFAGPTEAFLEELQDVEVALINIGPRKIYGNANEQAVLLAAGLPKMQLIINGGYPDENDIFSALDNETGDEALQHLSGVLAEKNYLPQIITEPSRLRRVLAGVRKIQQKPYEAGEELTDEEREALKRFVSAFLTDPRHFPYFEQNEEELLASLLSKNRISLALKPRARTLLQTHEVWLEETFHPYSQFHRDFLNQMEPRIRAKLFEPKLLSGTREEDIRHFIFQELQVSVLEAQGFIAGLNPNKNLMAQGVRLEKVEDFSSGRGLDEGSLVNKITLRHGAWQLEFFLKGFGNGRKGKAGKQARKAQYYETFYFKLAELLGLNSVESQFYSDIRDPSLSGYTLMGVIPGMDSGLLFDRDGLQFRLKAEYQPHQSQLIGEWAQFAALGDALFAGDRRIIQNENPQYQANHMIDPHALRHERPAVYALDHNWLFNPDNTFTEKDLERNGSPEIGFLGALPEFETEEGRLQLFEAYRAAYLEQWQQILRKRAQIENLLVPFFGENSYEHETFRTAISADPEETLSRQWQALLKYHAVQRSEMRDEEDISDSLSRRAEKVLQLQHFRRSFIHEDDLLLLRNAVNERVPEELEAYAADVIALFYKRIGQRRAGHFTIYNANIVERIVLQHALGPVGFGKGSLRGVLKDWDWRTSNIHKNIENKRALVRELLASRINSAGQFSDDFIEKLIAKQTSSNASRILKYLMEKKAVSPQQMEQWIRQAIPNVELMLQKEFSDLKQEHPEETFPEIHPRPFVSDEPQQDLGVDEAMIQEKQAEVESGKSVKAVLTPGQKEKMQAQLANALESLVQAADSPNAKMTPSLRDQIMALLPALEDIQADAAADKFGDAYLGLVKIDLVLHALIAQKNTDHWIENLAAVRKEVRKPLELLQKKEKQLAGDMKKAQEFEPYREFGRPDTEKRIVRLFQDVDDALTESELPDTYEMNLAAIHAGIHKTVALVKDGKYVRAYRESILLGTSLSALAVPAQEGNAVPGVVLALIGRLKPRFSDLTKQLQGQAFHRSDLRLASEALRAKTDVSRSEARRELLIDKRTLPYWKETPGEAEVRQRLIYLLWQAIREDSGFAAMSDTLQDLERFGYNGFFLNIENQNFRESLNRIINHLKKHEIEPEVLKPAYELFGNLKMHAKAGVILIRVQPFEDGKRVELMTLDRGRGIQQRDLEITDEERMDRFAEIVDGSPIGFGTGLYNLQKLPDLRIEVLPGQGSHVTVGLTVPAARSEVRAESYLVTAVNLFPNGSGLDASFREKGLGRKGTAVISRTEKEGDVTWNLRVQIPGAPVSTHSIRINMSDADAVSLLGSIFVDSEASRPLLAEAWASLRRTLPTVLQKRIAKSEKEIDEARRGMAAAILEKSSSLAQQDIKDRGLLTVMADVRIYGDAVENLVASPKTVWFSPEDRAEIYRLVEERIQGRDFSSRSESRKIPLNEQTMIALELLKIDRPDEAERLESLTARYSPLDDFKNDGPSIPVSERVLSAIRQVSGKVETFPFLALADWYETRGDSRADSLRLFVENTLIPFLQRWRFRAEGSSNWSLAGVSDGARKNAQRGHFVRIWNYFQKTLEPQIKRVLDPVEGQPRGISQFELDRLRQFLSRHRGTADAVERIRAAARRNPSQPTREAMVEIALGKTVLSDYPKPILYELLEIFRTPMDGAHVRPPVNRYEVTGILRAAGPEIYLAIPAAPLPRENPSYAFPDEMQESWREAAIRDAADVLTQLQFYPAAFEETRSILLGARAVQEIDPEKDYEVLTKIRQAFRNHFKFNLTDHQINGVLIEAGRYADSAEPLVAVLSSSPDVSRSDLRSGQEPNVPDTTLGRDGLRSASQALRAKPDVSRSESRNVMKALDGKAAPLIPMTIQFLDIFAQLAEEYQGQLKIEDETGSTYVNMQVLNGTDVNMRFTPLSDDTLVLSQNYQGGNFFIGDYPMHIEFDLDQKFAIAAVYIALDAAGDHYAKFEILVKYPKRALQPLVLNDEIFSQFATGKIIMPERMKGILPIKDIVLRTSLLDREAFERRKASSRSESRFPAENELDAIENEIKGLENELRLIITRTNIAVLSRILRDRERIRDWVEDLIMDFSEANVFEGRLRSIQERAEMYLEILEAERQEARNKRRSELRIAQRAASEIAAAGNVSPESAQEIAVSNVPEVIGRMETIEAEMKQKALAGDPFTQKAYGRIAQIVALVNKITQNDEGAPIAVAVPRLENPMQAKSLAAKHAHEAAKLRQAIGQVTLTGEHRGDFERAFAGQGLTTRTDGNVRHTPLAEDQVLPIVKIGRGAWDPQMPQALVIATEDNGNENGANAEDTETVAVVMQYAVSVLAARYLTPEKLKKPQEISALLKQLSDLGIQANHMFHVEGGKVSILMQRVQEFVQSFQAELAMEQSA
jgi:hypothetical protein